MFSRFTRAALPALLIVLVAIAVTLTFSPEARAAVQALMSFNGVTVSLGDDGKLTATGNTDAIVHQDDYSVAVQSDDGCQVQGISVAPPPTSEYLATADVLAQNPDLVLPKVPAGYTLAPQAEVVSDGRIVLNWADTSDHTIVYARNSAAPLTIAWPSEARGSRSNELACPDIVSINSSFHARFHSLMRFSRAIASSIVACCSNQTSMCTP